MTNTTVSIKPMHISRSMLGAILLAFFLPFVTISCGQAKLSVSGIAMVVGGSATVSDGVRSEPAGDPVPRQPLMVGAFLLAVAGLGLSFIKRLRQRPLLWLMTACGALGSLAFLIFWLVMGIAVGKQGIDLSYNFGFWLAWLLFAAFTGLHAWQAMGGRLGQMAVPLPAAVGELRMPRGLAALTAGGGGLTCACHSCGGAIHADAIFCRHCGALPQATLHAELGASPTPPAKADS